LVAVDPFRCRELLQEEEEEEREKEGDPQDRPWPFDFFFFFFLFFFFFGSCTWLVWFVMVNLGLKLTQEKTKPNQTRPYQTDSREEKGRDCHECAFSKLWGQLTIIN